jgi:uncharacterized FlaG/YvyC family protein
MSVTNQSSITSLYAAAAIAPAKSAAVHAGDASANGEAVKLDTIPASPPPEVMQAVSKAAEVHQQLRASGWELRFSIHDTTGKVSVEVHDLRGNVVRTLTPGEALAVAEGAPLQ